MKLEQMPEQIAGDSWKRSLPRGFFVTGTGTDIGKTFVGSLLAAALSSHGMDVGVYKPVASGCRREEGQLISDDAEKLWRSAGRPRSLSDVSPQCFETPVAPNVAAQAEGTQIDGHLLRRGILAWRDFECVLVEGAGGILSPVSDDDLVVDLAVDFGFPLIVVVGNRLGCINETLLTLRAAEAYGLTVAAIVLNDLQNLGEDASAGTNQVEIERLTKRKVQRIAFGATCIEDALLSLLR